MNNWKRPSSIPFPSIWRTFERKQADGGIRKYWVQDLTPEYESIFIDMAKSIMKDELICKFSSKYMNLF